MLIVIPIKPYSAKGSNLGIDILMFCFLRDRIAKGSNITPPIKNLVKVNCMGLKSSDIDFNIISIVLNRKAERKI